LIQENTPVLESRRLLLRKFTEGDVEDMLPLYGDEEVNRFLPWFPMKTKAEAAAYLHHTIFPCYEKECAYSYAVVLKAAGRVVGYVHVHDIGGSNDLGYGLCREFWHQGITTEARAAVVERLRRVHFPFLTATHDIHNPYSGEVMKKLGMTYRYSYKEQWMPKNIPVVFRMYQLNLDGTDRTYTGYREIHPSFVERLP
jgi:acetyltransferase, GNAT family